MQCGDVPLPVYRNCASSKCPSAVNEYEMPVVAGCENVYVSGLIKDCARARQIAAGGSRKRRTGPVTIAPEPLDQVPVISVTLTWPAGNAAAGRASATSSTTQIAAGRTSTASHAAVLRRRSRGGGGNRSGADNSSRGVGRIERAGQRRRAAAGERAQAATSVQRPLRASERPCDGERRAMSSRPGKLGDLGRSDLPSL